MSVRTRDDLLVVVVAVAVALAVADSSVVVLALGDLYSTFDVSIVAVSWTITAYNLAIVAGAVAVLPLEPRMPGHVMAAVGFATFAAASLLCGAAGTFELLIAGRCLQGAGAAFALAGAVPVFVGIRGSDEHAIAVWGTAATIGAALGPALGGLLTELFSWRAIFILQAPLGAAALLAVGSRAARDVEIPPRRERAPHTTIANVGFLALYGALVGALFLAVLLVVVVWGWSPLTGALVVSTLPAGAIAVRRFPHVMPTTVAVTTGGIALVGGLVALALLPDATASWAAPALASCGVGLGLLGGVLAPASVPATDPGVRAATLSIGARHAGFVIGLAVIAPILAADIDQAALDATRATTAEILDSTVSLRTKVDLAFALRDLVADAPRGEVPDITTVFDDTDGDVEMRATEGSVTSAIEDTLTRAFRPSFLVAAAFGAAAGIVALFLPSARTGGVRFGAVALTVAIACAIVAVLVAEMRAGAHDYGTRAYVAPCDAPADPFPQGDGFDGTLQRISLSALNGAACELDTGREELLLSLERRSGFGPEVTWTQETVESALRAGLVRAIDDADERDTLPGFVATALRFVAQRAPIDWVLGRFDIPFLEE